MKTYIRAALMAGFVLALSSCMGSLKKPEKTYNQKLLEEIQAKEKAGQNPYAEPSQEATADPVQSSLWARSIGSPYIIRNQKAQKVGDLLTIQIDESATATTSAKTDAKKDSKNEINGGLAFGQGENETVGGIEGSAGSKNEFKGEGKTDRSGRFETTVQAVVESVLPNGTLFVRGRKVITINNEDQEVEISGFVRPDDIRINNTVISSVMADAEIRYVGQGVVSDKQRVGWGTRFVEAIWPF